MTDPAEDDSRGVHGASNSPEQVLQGEQNEEGGSLGDDEADADDNGDEDEDEEEEHIDPVEFKERMERARAMAIIRGAQSKRSILEKQVLQEMSPAARNNPGSGNFDFFGAAAAGSPVGGRIRHRRASWSQPAHSRPFLRPSRDSSQDSRERERLSSHTSEIHGLQAPPVPKEQSNAGGEAPPKPRRHRRASTQITTGLRLGGTDRSDLGPAPKAAKLGVNRKHRSRR